MTLEEAKELLIANRPDRPKSSDRRRLQKAVDVILEALYDRTSGEWTPVSHDGKDDTFVCSNCLREADLKTRFCPRCGAYMGILDTLEDEPEALESPK